MRRAGQLPEQLFVASEVPARSCPLTGPERERRGAVAVAQQADHRSAIDPAREPGAEVLRVEPALLRVEPEEVGRLARDRALEGDLRRELTDGGDVVPLHDGKIDVAELEE